MSAPRKPRAVLVFNPAAGRANDDLEQVRDALAERYLVSVLSSGPGWTAETFAARALVEPVDLVIAAGGDGTVSMVAGGLVDRGVPLGIVPRGTANSIARGLGIPADLEGALSALTAGRPTAIDTAWANGRTMLLHASVGFHAAMVGGADRDAKNRWGVLAYVNEALRNLRDLDPFAVELETESEIVRCRAASITVANVVSGRTLLSQGAGSPSPKDGMLDVTIVAATGLAEAVATGLHLLQTAVRGEPATRDNIGYLAARSVRIRTDPPQPLLIDGEPAGEGDLIVRCRPRSLRVIVPVPPDAEPNGERKLDGLPELEIEAKR